MGSRSKKGFNDRCTRRGPLSGVELERQLNVCENHKQYNRVTRRTAHARLRHHCRYLRRNTEPKNRTSVQKSVLALEPLL